MNEKIEKLNYITDKNANKLDEITLLMVSVLNKLDKDIIKLQLRPKEKVIKTVIKEVPKKKKGLFK